MKEKKQGPQEMGRLKKTLEKLYLSFYLIYFCFTTGPPITYYWWWVLHILTILSIFCFLFSHLWILFLHPSLETPILQLSSLMTLFFQKKKSLMTLSSPSFNFVVPTGHHYTATPPWLCLAMLDAMLICLEGLPALLFLEIFLSYELH